MIKVLIYSLNYKPEVVGIGKYSGEMGAWLAEHGFDVRVVCAPPYYPEWLLNKVYHPWRYHHERCYNLQICRAPLFVPHNPGTFKRMLHLISFAITSFPPMLKKVFWKPDVVIVIEPSFFCAPTGLLVSWLTGGKSLLHVQDFELEALLGLGMFNGQSMVRIFKTVESWIMRRFSVISAISNTMLAKAGEKTNNQVPLQFFPNWVDTDFIKPSVDSSFFRKLWNIADDVQIVLYSGNLGAKQGLELLLDAAASFKDDKVLFLLVGDGVRKQFMIDYAANLGLTNIRFEGLQPYADLPALMALADVHLIIQKIGAADAVLPSKLTTILAAGGYALITAEMNTELGLLCEQFPGIAERVEPECLEDFVSALQVMLQEAKSGRPKVNLIAHNYALKYLNKEYILGQFAELLKSMSAK